MILISENKILEDFERYKADPKKTMPNPMNCAYYYRLLKQYGLMPDIPNKNELKKQAIEIYVTEIKKFHQERFNILIKEGLKNNESVNNIALQLALKWYFDECITNNKEII